MAAANLSEVILNARENILSEDMNRLQRLSAREILNLAQGQFSGPAGSFPQALRPLGNLAFVAGWTMNVPANEVYAPISFPPVGADDSEFQVLRWWGALATDPITDPYPVTFLAADPVLDRLDLIVAIPNNIGMNPTSRNILVDPVLRTVVASSVNKTQNPRATLQVIAGVPAGSPQPPAPPVGSVPLYIVRVPGGAVDASANAFGFRAFPFSGVAGRLHGILKGCFQAWDTTFGVPYISDSASLGNVVAIDGEIIAFTSTYGAPGRRPLFFGDALANPYTTPAAPGTASRPHYHYLVAGRHAPQFTGSAGITHAAVVASLTPPDPQTGMPSAPIQPPQGGTTQLGALYIGLGYTYPGGVVQQPIVQDDRFAVGLDGFVEVVGDTFAGVTITKNLLSRPSFSFCALVGLLGYADVATVVAPASSRLISAFPPTGNPRIQVEAAVIDGAGGYSIPVYNHTQLRNSGQVKFDSSSLAVPDQFTLEVYGWAHRVPRYGM